MTYQDIVVILKDFIKFKNITTSAPIPADESLMRNIGEYLSFSSGKFIEVLPIETSSRLILGKLRHFEYSVQVLVNQDALNICWTRYVIVKELAHLIMSKNSDGITEDIDKLIDGLFSASFGFSDDLDHELLAVLFAADYLLPYETTQEKLKDLSISSDDIANEFKVPKRIVNLLRAHHKLRDDAYKDLDIVHNIILQDV